MNIQTINCPNCNQKMSFPAAFDFSNKVCPGCKSNLVQRDAPNGVGTNLKASLSWLEKLVSAKGQAGCDRCRDKAAELDRWGPDKCEERIETIVSWLVESANAYGVTLGIPGAQMAAKIAARALVSRAIQRTRQELAKAAQSSVQPPARSDRRRSGG